MSSRNGSDGIVKAIVYAALFHALVAVLLVVSFAWHSATLPLSRQGKPDVMQAVVVSSAKMQKELEQLRQQQEQQRQREEVERERAAEETRRAEQKRLDEIEQRKTAEAEKKRKLEEQKKKQEADKKRKLEEQEKKRKADACSTELKKAQAKKSLDAATRRKLDDLCAPAVLKKFEAERKADEKRPAPQKPDKAAREREERDRAMKEAMVAEERKRVGDQYESLIQKQVSDNWARPIGAPKGLKCRVRARLGANGEVISANIIESSGNPAFDRSVEAAIYKASPLRVPDDRAVFEDRFREFNFFFNPGG